jgi:hypothetical protein
MQKTEATQVRNQTQQDNQSKAEQPCHERSEKVGGEALKVNENDVRKQPQQDDQSKAEEPCHERSEKVGGEALKVNENDVRDQKQTGSEAVKSGERSDADNKN